MIIINVLPTHETQIMTLEQRYLWLEREPGPRMIKEALKLIGTTELSGNKHNATIISWAKEIGENVADVYKADEIPWCGLFLAIVAKRAQKKLVKDPLWALNWSTFGARKETPELGDVLVFTRKGGGHVGLYTGEDEEAYHVLGGNQADCVCIKRIAKSRLYVARTPLYRSRPTNIRKVFLSKTGLVSDNEQ